MNSEISKKNISGKWIKLIKGDITEEQVDAIVNAANSYLKHGGGVAGAIVRKGGFVIQEESDKIDYVPVGQAVLTSAGNLSSHYIIHTVGPRWGEGDEPQKLENAILNTLKLANEKKFSSISLPAISSGIFGFPKDLCAEIIIKTSMEFLKANPECPLEEIRICLFDDTTINAFDDVCKKVFRD